MYMHRLVCLMVFAVSLMVIPLSVQSYGNQHMESVIIEVDGDPNEHKKYIEDNHPFIEIISVYETLFNGIALQGKPDNLAKMESLDFIKAIHSVQTYESDAYPIPSLTDADNENLVYPNELNTTDYTGEGVKVGVIDTGIDYEHPDLQANFQTGYDLVDLDDDPMETLPSQGMPTLHGTHVAGIIAADGELKGVAPDADIHSYRALGPGGAGTSVQVIAAMEQAVKDGVDVMNLSLGNTVNGPDYPTSKAVNKAADLGIPVVIANGNSGPDQWTVGAPATAPKALSIGAASNPEKSPFLYEGKSDRKILLQEMAGSDPWNLEKAYPVLYGDPAEVDVNGKIVLLERGNTSYFEQARIAEKNGAAAIVFYSKEEGNFQDVENGAEPINIPIAAVSTVDGKWLKQQVENNQLYLDTEYAEVDTKVAPFSSRGPVTVNWDIKPDVLAPGTNIMSTVPGGYQPLQGTSMAAPHVAGVLALVKEAHPDWSLEQIYGAIKTTAKRLETEDGVPLDPIVQGMGKIQPEQAIKTNTIIDNPLLSFGKVDTYRETKTFEITIENTTDEKQTYYFDIPNRKSGITWKLPKSFTIDPHEKETIPIELEVSAAQLEEGLHQGWVTLNQDGETYHLPYLFVNQVTDNPKAMGFEFSLKPFSDNTYMYRLYLPEATRRVEVDLYDPDTLIFNRTFLEMDELKQGMNERELSEEEVGAPGYYVAVVTIYLENGGYKSYEMEMYIPY